MGAAVGGAFYVASSVAQGKPITTHGFVVSVVAGAAGDVVGTSLGGSYISNYIAGTSGGTLKGTLGAIGTSYVYNSFGGNKFSFSLKRRR